MLEICMRSIAAFVEAIQIWLAVSIKVKNPAQAAHPLRANYFVNV